MRKEEDAEEEKDDRDDGKDGEEDSMRILTREEDEHVTVERKRSSRHG